MSFIFQYAPAVEYPSTRNGFLAAYPSYWLADAWVVFPVFLTYGAVCALLGTVGKNYKPSFEVPAWTLRLHNAIQVVLSATMLLGLAVSAHSAGYSFSGNHSFRHTRPPTLASHYVFLFVRIFTLSKYYDLVDTAFIVLRGKRRLFSFLHCSHHCVVPLALWYGMMHSPAGDSYAPCMANR